MNDKGLEIGTNANEDIIFYTDNTQESLRLMHGENEPADIYFHGTSTPSLFVSESGKVGIGTKVPVANLEVRGELGIHDGSGTVHTQMYRETSTGGITVKRVNNSDG